MCEVELPVTKRTEKGNAPYIMPQPPCRECGNSRQVVWRMSHGAEKVADCHECCATEDNAMACLDCGGRDLTYTELTGLLTCNSCGAKWVPATLQRMP